MNGEAETDSNTCSIDPYGQRDLENLDSLSRFR